MPVQVESDASRDLTVFTAEGASTFHEIKTIIESFYRGQPTRHVVWNLGGCDLRNIATPEVEQLATLPSRHDDLRTQGRTAIVAPEDLSFGLSRIFQTMGEAAGLKYPVQVFRALGDAINWIEELPPEE